MNRRELITGLVTLVAAPAIVRAGSLMPIKSMIEIPPRIIFWTIPFDGAQPVERMRITWQNEIVLPVMAFLTEPELIGHIKS